MTNAAIDVYNDVAPKRANNKIVAPTQAELRDALQDANGTYYTDARLNKLTRNDLISATRDEGIEFPYTIEAE